MAGSIYVPILSSFNPSGVNNAKTALGGLAGAFDGVKRAVGLASASFVGFKAISETIDFGRSSIEAARDYESNLIGLDAIFGELAPKMEAFGKAAVDIGLSQNQAAKASTFIGSVLKQSGFSMEDVANQTQKLVSLASDLAFVYKYDVSEALSGITALFRGEYDPIEKFGVAMKQSEVNAVLAANGQDKLQGAARRNAEQMARLALFMDRTRDAQGKFQESSGSLAAEQRRLQAIFENLQIEVGTNLVPALVKVATAMQPLVKTLAPAISFLFQQFAGIIDILATQLNKAQSGFKTLLEVMGFLFSVIKAVLPFLIQNGAAIITFIAAFKGVIAITPILQGLLVQFALLRMELAAGTSVAALFGTTMATSLGPITLVAAGIAGIAAGMVLLAQEAEKAGLSTKELSDNFNEFKESAKNDPFKQLTASSLGYGIALDDIISKQAKAGLSIDDKAANQAKGEAARFGAMEKFFKAKGPIDAFQKLLDDLMKTFAGATGEADKKLGAITKKTASATKKVADDQRKALDAFKKSLTDLLPALRPLEIATREIGEFEQSTIDSFQNIADKVDEAFRDGIITQGAQREFAAYLAVERTAFLAINRQRDELVKKRGLAQTLIDDIKASIIGVGALAGLLETQTQQVTTATTKVVDGFTITTKRTVDEIVGGQGVLSKLSAIVAKTKAFAGQLTQLRRLGLNENLFKQIVEAGPDVGGQLAVEILAGGSDAVGALNTTFKELEDVAGQVAEQTAQVMYGSGVDVSNGLINGLLSQEQALVAAAETLANAFVNAFNALMAKLQVPSLANAGGTNAAGFAYTTDPMRGGTAESQFGSGTPWAQAVSSFRASQTPVVNNYITVKAGVVSNGKALGQELTALTNQYTKSSGL
jgi:hypothetical protein